MNDSYQHPGKWQDVTLVPTMGRSEANHFVMSHIVRGLERNSVYEAIIHAKNRYGWNEVSPLAYFITLPLTRPQSSAVKPQLPDCKQFGILNDKHFFGPEGMT